MPALDVDADDFLRSFDRALTRIGDRIETAVADTVDDAYDAAVWACPVDTGRLRSSIYRTVRRSAASVLGEVGTRGVSYAAVVEFGARPHEIVAHGDGMLRFEGRDGQPVFRKRVWHPGTRPYAFLRGAWVRVPADFRRHLAARFGGGR